MNIALDAGGALLLFLAAALSQHWVASLIDVSIGLVLAGGVVARLSDRLRGGGR